MAKAYSYDLRVRVIECIENGMSLTEVSRLFRVSRETLYKWLALKKKRGDIREKTGYQKGHSHKIIDLAKFEAFMKTQDGKSLRKIAQEFPEWGSQPTLWRALKKLQTTKTTKE